MSPEQPSKTSISHAELKSKAMATFFFDDDDLPSNRDGRLSNKQKQRFMTSTKIITTIFILSGLVLSALLVWVLEEPLDQLPWIVPALTTVSFTGIGIYGYRLGNKVYKSGIVESVTGTAAFERYSGEKFLRIDGVYFRSQRKFRQIFVPEVQYRIYYAPSDRTIVSVEILD